MVKFSRKLISIAALAGAACLFGAEARAGSDEEAVKAAVLAYTAAVDSRDPAKLEALWVHDDAVTNIEPGGKSVVVGFANIKKNLETFFPAFEEIKNVLADGPHVQIKGDVASAVTTFQVSFKTKSGVAGTNGIFATDVLEKHDGAWLLITHVASVVPK